MHRLNVVHVIGAMPVGGVERNLLRVLPLLDRERFNVSLVTIRERGELADDLERAGVPVKFIFMKTRYSPLSLWRLSRHFRAVGADIVHCHMRRANTSGRLAAMLARVPIRLAHERDQGLGKRPRHYLIDRLLARWNGPVLAVTKGTVEYNRIRSGIPAEKFIVLYNGLEVEQFQQPFDWAAERERYSLPLDRPVIGSIGRMHAIKDLPTLLRGFAQAKFPGRKPILLLAGEGKEEPSLRALADELGIAEDVKFLPWQHDLPSLYSVLDAFALTSLSEGIANVQLEAAAAGVPLVSTRVGIAAEAFCEGRDFLAVETGNPASVASALAEALVPERAEALRSAGREAVKEFTIQRQKENLEAIYERLWAERGQTCKKQA